MKREAEAAFREYVAGRLERLRRTAYLLCRDWDLAEDLTSITLGRLYQHWRRASEFGPVDAIDRAARGQCPEPVLVRCSVTVGPQGQVVVRGTVGPVPAGASARASGMGLSYQVVVVAWLGCYVYAELADGFAGWDGRGVPVPLAAPQLALGQLVDLVSVPDLTLG